MSLIHLPTTYIQTTPFLYNRDHDIHGQKLYNVIVSDYVKQFDFRGLENFAPLALHHHLTSDDYFKTLNRTAKLQRLYPVLSAEREEYYESRWFLFELLCRCGEHSGNTAIPQDLKAWFFNAFDLEVSPNYSPNIGETDSTVYPVPGYLSAAPAGTLISKSSSTKPHGVLHTNILPFDGKFRNEVASPLMTPAVFSPSRTSISSPHLSPSASTSGISFEAPVEAFDQMLHDYLAQPHAGTPTRQLNSSDNLFLDSILHPDALSVDEEPVIDEEGGCKGIDLHKALPSDIIDGMFTGELYSEAEQFQADEEDHLGFSGVLEDHIEWWGEVFDFMTPRHNPFVHTSN